MFSLWAVTVFSQYEKKSTLKFTSGNEDFTKKINEDREFRLCMYQLSYIIHLGYFFQPKNILITCFSTWLWWVPVIVATGLGN